MTNSRVRAAALGALVVVALVAYAAWHRREAPKSDVAVAPVADARNAAGTAVDSVSLSDAQLASVKVEPAAEREFPVERDAVGSIDFDEDMSVEIFTPYQGRIIALFAAVGDDVKKGQTLFTIDSPDLLQAES